MGQFVPQPQSGPQAQGEQVQFGFPQPEGWPQLQSGPQAQGEQVQFGFSQMVALMAAILLFRFPITSAVSRRGRRVVPR